MPSIPWLILRENLSPYFPRFQQPQLSHTSCIFGPLPGIGEIGPAGGAQVGGWFDDRGVDRGRWGVALGDRHPGTLSDNSPTPKLSTPEHEPEPEPIPSKGARL
jgi:hypothetical protein